jgi:prepilin-type processing-associated H-X9-DG protein
MNLYMGGFAKIPNGDVGGWPWAANYQVFNKLADVAGSSIGASRAFVFLDMRQDCINWGNFMTYPMGYAPNNTALYGFTTDFPGFYHNLACGFAFADGHSENHRWRDSRTMPPLGFWGAPPATPPDTTSSPRNQDVAWLQQHSTCSK